jgi:predicted GNAT family acetyltransferase
MNVDQLEDHLRAKYKGKLEEHANGAPMLDLMDKTEYGAFELKLIQVKKDQRGRGVGGQVMNDLLKYADDNNYIIVLSPSEIKTAKLIKWYKSFDFMENKNRNKDFRFMSRMIRYPHGMTRSKWIDARILPGYGLVGPSFQIQPHRVWCQRVQPRTIGRLR